MCTLVFVFVHALAQEDGGHKPYAPVQLLKAKVHLCSYAAFNSNLDVHCCVCGDDACSIEPSALLN